LHCGKVLGKALENFKYGLFVVHKYIAPHDGVGCSNAGETLKPGGRIFNHFSLEIIFELVGGIDNRVGDQVRQV